MVFFLAALLGLAFGAADQQLGTLTAELGPFLRAQRRLESR